MMRILRDMMRLSKFSKLSLSAPSTINLTHGIFLNSPDPSNFPWSILHTRFKSSDILHNTLVSPISLQIITHPTYMYHKIEWGSQTYSNTSIFDWKMANTWLKIFFPNFAFLRFAFCVFCVLRWFLALRCVLRLAFFTIVSSAHPCLWSGGQKLGEFPESGFGIAIPEYH